MNILLILDGDSKTDLSEDLRWKIGEIARGKGHEVRAIELKNADVPPCLGCLRCVTKHGGVCVHNESFVGIMKEAPHCPVVIFLTPVLFGTFSSTMKNVIDRGGIIIKKHNTCRQIIIGYGEDASDEERSTFIDITAKHRGKAEKVHLNLKENFDVFFAQSRADSDRIRESLASIV